MKRGWKKTMQIGGILILLLTTVVVSYKLSDIKNVGASELQKVYNVLPGDPEWEQLGSVADKIQACAISEEVLCSLSDKELLQAVLDYPFVIDLFATDDHKLAAQSIYDHSDAFHELVSRNNGKDIMMDWLREKCESDLSTLSGEDLLQINEIVILLKYTDELAETLTVDDKTILDELISVFHFTREQGQRMMLQPARFTVVPKRVPV